MTADDLPRSPVEPHSDWRLLARCHGMSTEQGSYDLFFGNDSREFRRSMCGPCPVSWECFKFAVDNDIDIGLWGGLTANERRVLLRRYAWRIGPQLRRAHTLRVAALANRKGTRLQ